MPRIREVRKRDNRIVPFDQSKIGDAIHKAIRSVGVGDRSLADDLAAAVALFLEKKFTGAIPSIEDIQDMVETVLQETGHADIAEAYIEYRKKRSRIREILQVHKEAPEGPRVEGGSREAAAPWRKAKIVAALVKEADLETSVAEDIASAVEEKVLRSGLRRISTALLRELVDNELFERGYAGKLKRQAPIGLPKYNLEQAIFSVDAKEPYYFAKDPEETEFVVARHILRQYALEDVFSSEVGEASRDQRIVLHRLGEPLRFHAINVGADPKLFTADGVTLAFVRLLRAVGKEISLPMDPSVSLLRELGVLAYRGRSIAVTADGSQPWPAPPSPGEPQAALHYRVFLDPAASCPPALLAGSAAYCARGLRVSYLVRPQPEPRLVPAKVSLNLPQLAFRSGRTRLGDLFGAIDGALGLALKAHLERRSFLARAARTADLPLGGLIGADHGMFRLDDATFAVGVFGIADAVKFVTGKEIFADRESLDLAVAIVDHLCEKTVREARGLGIRLRLEETMHPKLLDACAAYDAQRYPELGEVLRGRTGRPSYTPGVRLPAEAPLDPLTRNQYLAQISASIALGSIVEDDPELRAGGDEVIASLVEESLGAFAARARDLERAPFDADATPVDAGAG